jgi:hypothetical protein
MKQEKDPKTIQVRTASGVVKRLKYEELNVQRTLQTAQKAGRTNKAQQTAFEQDCRNFHKYPNDNDKRRREYGKHYNTFQEIRRFRAELLKMDCYK